MCDSYVENNMGLNKAINFLLPSNFTHVLHVEGSLYEKHCWKRVLSLHHCFENEALTISSGIMLLFEKIFV